MTTQAKDLGKVYRSAAGARALIGGIFFDWAMIGACIWLITGAYLDAWAHNNMPLDSFFTPWHGVLYSGFLVVAVVMIGAVVLNHARGANWHKAIPAGYELSVLGVFGFAVAGVGDLFWHTLFGIEKNIDAQFSPSHLLLMIGLGLLLGGPFRSAWKRTGPAQQSWPAQLTLPVSFLLLFSVFSLLTQGVQPLTMLAPALVPKAQQTLQLLSMLGFVFQSMIFVMLVLLAIRRWRMPVGSFTFILTLNATALSFMHGTYIVIPICAIAGGLIDVTYHV